METTLKKTDSDMHTLKIYQHMKTQNWKKKYSLSDVIVSDPFNRFVVLQTLCVFVTLFYLLSYIWIEFPYKDFQLPNEENVFLYLCTDSVQTTEYTQLTLISHKMCIMYFSLGHFYSIPVSFPALTYEYKCMRCFQPRFISNLSYCFIFVLNFIIFFFCAMFSACIIFFSSLMLNRFAFSEKFII